MGIGTLRRHHEQRTAESRAARATESPASADAPEQPEPSTEAAPIEPEAPKKHKIK